MLEMVRDFIDFKLESGEDFEVIENESEVLNQIESGSSVLSVEYIYNSKNGNQMWADIKINTFEMMGFIYSSLKKDENEDYDPR
jgi:hypothetical protein